MSIPAADGGIHRSWMRDLAVSFSLSNLLFLKSWGILLDPANFYFLERSPDRLNHIAVALNVLVCTVIGFVVAWAARHAALRTVRVCVRVAFVVLVAVALNGMRQQVPAASWGSLVRALGTTGATLVLGAAGGAGAAFAYRFRGDLARLCEALLLCMLPVPLLLIARIGNETLWNDGGPSAFVDAVNAPFRAAMAPAGRVLWIVFDELDYRLAFSNRPSSVPLPAFDRLLRESLHATGADQAGDETGTAIPSLLIGSRIVDVRRVGPRDLLLRLRDGDPWVSWRAHPTVFTRAATLGADSGLAGWYHPYCRILGDSLARCSWRAYVFEDPTRSVFERMRAQAPLVVGSIPMAFRLGVLAPDNYVFYESTPEWHRGQSERILAEAVSLVTDARLGLVFVHFPLPHAPWIYDRKTERFDSSGATYLDNLVLADRTLAGLREEMEKAGVWDRMAIVVTSDHGFNKGKVLSGTGDLAWLAREAPALVGTRDLRVPFIVKLPGRAEERVHEEPFSAIRAHDVVLGILAGEVRTADDVIDLIRSRASTEQRMDGGRVSGGRRRASVKRKPD